MNYYIQGDAANADKIKAAFERNGIDTSANSNYGISNLFYFSCNGEVAVTQNGSIISIIKTHPDYKELELPVEPHYDISNFYAGMPVLVRIDNSLNWSYALFSHYNKGWAYPFSVACCCSVKQCIPFNDDTKHLLGTTDMCDKMYINW